MQTTTETFNAIYNYSQKLPTANSANTDWSFANLHLLFIEIKAAQTRSDDVDFKKFVLLFISIIQKNNQIKFESVANISLDLIELVFNSSQSKLIKYFTIYVFNRLVQMRGSQSRNVQIARLLKYSEYEDRNQFVKNMLNNLESTYPFSRKIAEFTLIYLIDSNDESQTAKNSFRSISAMHPKSLKLRRLVLRLSNKKSDIFQLDDAELNAFQETGGRDNATLQLIGLIRVKKGEMDVGINLLEKSILGCKPDLSVLLEICNAAVNNNCKQLAIQCLGTIKLIGVVNTSVIRKLADLIKGNDFSPHWEDILQFHLNVTDIDKNDKDEMQLLLVEELFRINRHNDAINKYNETNNRETASPKLRKMVIRKFMEMGEYYKAQNEFEKFVKENCEPNYEFSIDYRLLQIRAAERDKEPAKAWRLIESAPQHFNDDPFFLLEKCLRYLKEKSWRKLRLLLYENDYGEPTLKMVNLIAAEKNQEYGLVREEFTPELLRFDPGLISLPMFQFDYWKELVEKEAAYSILYSFAVERDWNMVHNIIKSPFISFTNRQDVDFFQLLAAIYLEFENDEVLNVNFNNVCAKFEKLLILTDNPYKLELVASLFNRNILNNSAFIANTYKVNDFASYLLYIALTYIEIELSKPEKERPKDWREISNSMCDLDLNKAMALVLRAQT